VNKPICEAIIERLIHKLDTEWVDTALLLACARQDTEKCEDRCNDGLCALIKAGIVEEQVLDGLVRLSDWFRRGARRGFGKEEAK
jgi:hypothetical protein